MSANERAIIKAFNAGDQKAFTIIHHTFHTYLLNYAIKFIHNQPEAEEIVDNSFMKLWEHASPFDSFEHIKAFLFKITYNACSNWLKHNHVVIRREKDIQAVLAAHEETAIQQAEIESEILKKMMEMGQQLGGQSREMFRLLIEEKLTPKEIQERTSKVPQTIRNQKATMLKELRALLFKEKEKK